MATVLSGCVAAQEDDSCGAKTRQHLIGRDAAVLQTEPLPDMVRILQFGDVMTMDHNPGRLNIQSDPAGIINRVWCG